MATIKLRRPHSGQRCMQNAPSAAEGTCFTPACIISAGEVIRKRIALEAKLLLVNFNLSIQEVADRLNFADNSYFTKFFKKQEGVSPEQFRKEII